MSVKAAPIFDADPGTKDMQLTPRAAAPPAPPRNVYECIAAVQAELSQTGIAKTRKNAQQGYSFRGIDEVLNALAPMLAKHRLVILPRMLTRACVERVAKSGSAQFYVVVEAEFDFVSALDGSMHVARTFGEAQDSADKATNKAMSAAYKYAAFLTFCIPLEGMGADADATTPDLVVLAAPAAPAGYQDWLDDLRATADEGEAALRTAWTASKTECRRHLTSTDNGTWEAIKARAATKGAA